MYKVKVQGDAWVWKFNIKQEAEAFCRNLRRQGLKAEVK